MLRFKGMRGEGGNGAPGTRRVPEGVRAYAIGDIHGRLDLLDQLLGIVAGDDASRPPARTHLVFLGDYVDRGPNSAGVVARLMTLMDGKKTVHCLMGNHEEILLAAAEGDPRAAALFARVGGRETLASYGIAPVLLEGANPGQVIELIRRHVPAAHLAWLRALGPRYRLGDYLFVHAGIRPGIPLHRQSEQDLRWIREPFLTDDRDHEAMVVHGHTISTTPDLRPNRIGIDTGAYASGRLTALGLEGEQVWFLRS